MAAGSRDFGIKTNLIGIMEPTFGTERCQAGLDACLAHRDRLVAIDLAGDELGFPGELFTDHFRRVRDAGMRVTVHAGEAAGPEHVAGHSRAGEPSASATASRPSRIRPLMAYLAEHRIGIESRLTSNLQTTTVASLADHPIRQFLAAGVLACLNTDDPAVEGDRPASRIRGGCPAAGMTVSEIRTASRTA